MSSDYELMVMSGGLQPPDNLMERDVPRVAAGQNYLCARGVFPALDLGQAAALYAAAPANYSAASGDLYDHDLSP